MGPDLVTAIGLVTAVAAVAFAALTVAGVVLIARRTRQGALTPRPGRTDAGVALVRADDAVRAAADDLEFAQAQFGQARTKDFAAALEQARRDLATAFELQNKLDDAVPDGVQRTKDWTKRIRVLADRARISLAAESAKFEDLRRAEASAPETVRMLRAAVESAQTRRAEAASILAGLRSAYVPDAVAPVAGNPAEADVALAEALAFIDSAESALATSRVTAVTDALRSAHDSLRTAGSLLDAVEHRRDELAAAEAGITTLQAEERAALAAARSLRDAPPDPDSAAAVNDAIAKLESEIAAAGRPGRRDPVAQLDRLVDASDALDIAIAAARNQQRRLEGARAALAGALVSARAQLSAVSDYIGAHGAGAGARSRLAEGRRELLVAENEADPVAALDAARRAQTHARDADALARYAGTG